MIDELINTLSILSLFEGITKKQVFILLNIYFSLHMRLNNSIIPI